MFKFGTMPDNHEALKTWRILVVDDDRVILHLITTVLKNARYEVMEHTNGLDGLRSAQQQPPDLVILDLMLGDIGGEMVYNILRSDSRTAHIPVVICTVHREPTLRRRLKTEAPHILFKPFTPQALLSAVEAALVK